MSDTLTEKDIDKLDDKTIAALAKRHESVILKQQEEARKANSLHAPPISDMKDVLRKQNQVGVSVKVQNLLRKNPFLEDVIGEGETFDAKTLAAAKEAGRDGAQSALDEAKAKAEADAQAKIEADAKAKAEADAKAKAEAEKAAAAKPAGKTK